MECLEAMVRVLRDRVPALDKVSGEVEEEWEAPGLEQGRLESASARFAGQLSPTRGEFPVTR